MAGAVGSRQRCSLPDSCSSPSRGGGSREPTVDRLASRVRRWTLLERERRRQGEGRPSLRRVSPRGCWPRLPPDPSHLESGGRREAGVAQALVLVCDECGRPDATTITIRAGDANYVKDLCSDHLKALLKDTRAPRRGRPKTTGASPSRRRPKTQAKRVSRKPSATRKTRTARKPSKRKAASTPR